MSYFDLKVGFTCNNNCIHCVITDKKSTKDLTTQEIKNIIDTISKDLIVGFTGGEATIRSDFLELLKHAKNTCHKTALQTNGSMFYDEQFTKIASQYLDSVLIAIHSSKKEIHDSIVRMPGMYEKTIQGFKNIIKYKIPCTTQTVISKYNIDSILETYDFIQSISPSIRMNLTFPHPNGNAFLNSDVVVPRYIEIAKQLQSILKKYGHLLNTEAIPICYLYPYQDIVYNSDEHITDQLKQGIDPANRNNKFFDQNGFTKNYSESILSEKLKGIKCKECIFDNRCVGVWKEYIQIHKNHFDLYPIKEQNITRESGSVIIYGQEKCLNTCLFCKGTSEPDSINSKFNKAINDINYHLSNGVNYFEISGGDPGEFPKITEVIKHISNHGCKTQLSTHGRTLKDRNFVKSLKLSGITCIKIPLYGSNDTIHNKTTQVNNSSGNSFEDTIQGIKNCVIEKIPIVGYTLLNQYNKFDIINIIELYQSLANNLLESFSIGLTFISKLEYSYTRDWFLPIKDMQDILKKVKLYAEVDNLKINFLDIPYCVFDEYTSLVYNLKDEYPNLGLHDVEKSNQSDISSKIPHYRIKSYFEECEKCSLKPKCGGIPLNEIKMFGTWGLKAINENSN